MLTEEIKQKIRYLAGISYPNECCGFLTELGLMPIMNTSEQPEHFAQIEAADYAKAEEQGIIFIYHSHAEEDNFSRQDITACKALGVPFVMYCVKWDRFIVGNPNGGDLIARDWIYGLHDCYDLIRSWYKQERSIELDDFQRGEVSETRSEDWNVFAENFEAQGFIRLSPYGIKFQAGDVLLMQIASPNPNHLGLIFDADRQEFMHHLIDQQSSIEPYGGFWAQHTIGILRYVG